MAQHLVSSQVKVNFVDKTKATAGSAADSNSAVATPANYASETAIDTRLLAIGGVFTQKYVDMMNLNDKIYALRMNDDSGTV